MTIKRNLIVTCGTSQISSERVQALGIPNRDAFDSRLRRSDERVVEQSAMYEGLDPLLVKFLSPFNESGSIRITPLNQFFENLKNRLFENTRALLEGVDSQAASRIFERWFEGMRPGQTQLLGAELATLGVMRYTKEERLDKEEGLDGRNSFMPDRDHVTLLWSDTLAGAFCASTVRQFLLEKKWIRDSAHLSAIRIEGLKEQVEFGKAEVVDGNIRKALEDAVLHAPPVDKHVIVYSGGFKSLIPMLTLFGQANQINLYCLFENSTILRRTYFPSDSQKLVVFENYESGKRTSSTPSGLRIGSTT